MENDDGGVTLAKRLELHRDYHFRRLPARRVVSERAALQFVNDTGFCAAFTAGLGVPCLREAIEGRREPAVPHHIQHDPAIMMTWNLKDRLPARKLVYYGKVIGGRPGFIARAMLPAFLRLRIAPGGYRRLYQNGQLSNCAKLIMDTLVRRGPAETRALKLSSGYAQTRHRAQFDRAMKELQERFLALKVEEHYDPFTYVWDTLEHRWKDAVSQSRALTVRAAAYVIVRRYFEVAAYGRAGALARLLRIDEDLIETAMCRLEREGMLKRDQRIDGVRERVTVLTRYAS